MLIDALVMRPHYCMLLDCTRSESLCSCEEQTSLLLNRGVVFFFIRTVERERTRRTVSVLLNIGARGLNHCHSGTAIHITYSECVPVALGIQHAVRVRHIVMWSIMEL
jgi:hypothetical protein